MEDTKEKYRELIIEMLNRIEDVELLKKLYTFIKHS